VGGGVFLKERGLLVGGGGGGDLFSWNSRANFRFKMSVAVSYRTRVYWLTEHVSTGFQILGYSK